MSLQHWHLDAKIPWHSKLISEAYPPLKPAPPTFFCFSVGANCILLSCPGQKPGKSLSTPSPPTLHPSHQVIPLPPPLRYIQHLVVSPHLHCWLSLVQASIFTLLVWWYSLHHGFPTVCPYSSTRLSLCQIRPLLRSTPPMAYTALENLGEHHFSKLFPCYPCHGHIVLPAIPKPHSRKWPFPCPMLSAPGSVFSQPGPQSMPPLPLRLAWLSLCPTTRCKISMTSSSCSPFSPALLYFSFVFHSTCQLLTYNIIYSFVLTAYCCFPPARCKHRRNICLCVLFPNIFHAPRRMPSSKERLSKHLLSKWILKNLT